MFSSWQINAEQWLSNEKAQLSLLLPTWVPSKISITTGSAEKSPHGGGETVADCAAPAVPEIRRKVSTITEYLSMSAFLELSSILACLPDFNCYWERLLARSAYRQAMS